MAGKTLIIGAGSAGLTCAYQLAKKGREVEVVEASDHVGGLARSFELWGQTVDCGPHRFFSQDKRVNDFFKEIIQDDYVHVHRLTRIYYQGKYFYYPLKPLNALLNLGPLGSVQVLMSYVIQNLKRKKELLSFEDWVTDRFGKKLFEVFFKNYSEKLWGIPCSRIDADWAAQRIKKLSLWEVVKNTLVGDENQKHNTLVDQFAYPKKGTGQIYQSLRAKILELGGKVELDRPVKKIVVKDDQVKGVEMSKGEMIAASQVVSTMPLNLMVKGLDNVPDAVLEACDRLKFRNTILVYVEVDSKNLFKDNWIYVHSPEVKHGRITNFRNWSPELYGDKQTSILCLEFWCFNEDDLWKADDEYIASLAKKELDITNILPSGTKIFNSLVLRLPRCYPLYEIGYQENIKVIREYLNKINGLIPIGRYGSFKYNNQDHSMLMGILAAKQIISGDPQSLWDVNTDLEYQESGVSLETGLDR